MEFFKRWADLAMATGGLALVLALLPSLWDRTVLPYTTTLLTGAILTAWLPFYWAMGLRVAVVTMGLSAAIWWALAAIKLLA